MKYKDSSDTNGGVGLSPTDGKILKHRRFATVCKNLRIRIIRGGNDLPMGG